MTMNGDITVSGTVAGSVRMLYGSILLTSMARVSSPGVRVRLTHPPFSLELVHC